MAPHSRCAEIRREHLRLERMHDSLARIERGLDPVEA
jgi:hypothetical protein